MQAIIAVDADVNAKNKQGMTPLYIAKTEGKTEIIDILKSETKVVKKQ